MFLLPILPRETEKKKNKVLWYRGNLPRNQQAVNPSSVPQVLPLPSTNSALSQPSPPRPRPRIRPPCSYKSRTARIPCIPAVLLFPAINRSTHRQTFHIQKKYSSIRTTHKKKTRHPACFPASLSCLQMASAVLFQPKTPQQRRLYSVQSRTKKKSSFPLPRQPTCPPRSLPPLEKEFRTKKGTDLVPEMTSAAAPPRHPAHEQILF